MSTKITTQALSDMLAEKAGINKRTADAFVKAFVQTVIDGGISDGVVKIKGLGTFKTVKVADRESTNVNTGERFLIAGYTKLSFTPDVDIQSSATTETAPTESETSAPAIETPAPVAETPKVEAPKVETPAPVVETPKVEETKAETPAPVVETPKVEAPKVETPAPVFDTDATKTYEKPDDGKPAPSALSQLYDIVKKYKKWLWLFAVIALAVIMLVILLSKNKNHEEPQQQTNPFTETVPATQSGPRIEPSAEEPATDENKRPRIHILQKGETLTTISVLYYHTPDSMGAIWKLNKFPDPNNIPLGTEIQLP
ncbi:MAG: HU family DNA-binding protein [Prevotellaceae bacterium]|nr:HU family DNA-binding protein [Candidatus Colivivens caballi]